MRCGMGDDNPLSGVLFGRARVVGAFPTTQEEAVEKAARFEERLHPRGREGQFAAKPGGASAGAGMFRPGDREVFGSVGMVVEAWGQAKARLRDAGFERERKTKDTPYPGGWTGKTSWYRRADGSRVSVEMVWHPKSDKQRLRIVEEAAEPKAEPKAAPRPEPKPEPKPAPRPEPKRPEPRKEPERPKESELDRLRRERDKAHEESEAAAKAVAGFLDGAKVKYKTGTTDKDVYFLLDRPLGWREVERMKEGMDGRTLGKLSYLVDYEEEGSDGKPEVSVRYMESEIEEEIEEMEEAEDEDDDDWGEEGYEDDED